MSNETGGIYEDRAIVFLDILGFKKHIEDNREADLLDALDIPFSSFAADFPGGLNCEISAFSDSIVISTKLHDENEQPCGGAHLLVFLASYLQLKLIALGMLVRGGATVGRLYHKSGKLLGPAMNEAYEIESQLAIYPRVAISEALRNRHDAEMKCYRSVGSVEEKKIIQEFVEETFWTGDDGVQYINCLARHAPLPPEFVWDKSKLHERGHPAAYGLDGGLEYKLDIARKPLADRPHDVRAAAKHDWFSNYLAKIKSSQT